LNPVQELSGGSPTANLLTGLGIDEYFTRTEGSTTRHYLTEAIGSSVALTDGTGAVQTEYTYEPYGATTQSGTGSTNPARYTGREEDGTGLYYYRARYYDPRRQRFTSEDQLGFGGGDVNLYAYVAGSPTNFSDPSGNIGPAAALLLGCALGAGATAGADLMAGRKINWSLAAAGCMAGGLGGFFGAGGAAAAGAAGAGAGGGSGAAGAAAGAAAAGLAQVLQRVSTTPKF
jgi:RHS repeat-associated protein